MEADKAALSDPGPHESIIVQTQPGNESGQSVSDVPEDQLSPRFFASGRPAAVFQSTFPSRGRT